MTWKQVTNMEHLAKEAYAGGGAVLKYNYRVLAVSFCQPGFLRGFNEFVNRCSVTESIQSDRQNPIIVL